MAQRKNENAGKDPPAELLYEFECEAIPAELHLGIERPDLYTFRLNGTEFKAEDDGFWVRSFHAETQTSRFASQTGANQLELETVYHELLPGLEALFLLGNFGVREETITALPDSQNIGDWCSQGFQNYAGNLTYRTTFLRPDAERAVILEIPEWRGVALGVRVNGSDRKCFPGRPTAWTSPPCSKTGKTHSK